MNQREDILKEALQKIEEDSQRWQLYIKEHETAIENMNMFCKRLVVDVMVPVGKKAFMPGYLLHTNEVLVGHFQGYFSKCTAYKAKEICDSRIKRAKEFLKNLDTEADMWQNKLYKPYADGALPCGEEREIIEEYDEETEKLWKEKHRIAVKQSKVKEREEREKIQKFKDLDPFNEKSDNEIFNTLDEAELLEELTKELDTLHVDEVNDETILKLLSGEIKLPQERKRLAHIKNTSTESLTMNEESLNSINNSTNNNVLPNPLIMNQVSSDVEEVQEETLPEVALVKKQAQYLNTEDQIGFYEYQIQIIRQKLHLQPLRTQEELNDKIYLLNILEHLEELLEEAEECLGEKELSEKDEENDQNGDNLKFTADQRKNSEKNFEENAGTKSCNKSKPKRRISFALEDQTLEFRNHEAVTQMLPPKIEKPQRDVIRLNDNNEENKDKNNQKSENFSSKMDFIHDKVEKNFQFMQENQSKQDFDLVQQIIQSSKSPSTLHIKFKHSQQEGYKSKDISETICSPADFYKLYAQSQEPLENCNKTLTLFLNSYEGEEQVKAPVLKEADRQTSFINPKLEFSNPTQAKSILKNKLVDKEIGKQLNTNNKDKKSKNKSSKKEECDYLSAYDKVMNDVVEKPLTEPEPLPDVKFIDAHTPKKRISRFKQMRQGNDKT